MRYLFGCIVGSEGREGLDFCVMHIATLPGLVWDGRCQPLNYCLAKQPYNGANYNAMKDIQVFLSHRGCPTNAAFIADVKALETTCLRTLRVYTLDSETDFYCQRIRDSRNNRGRSVWDFLIGPDDVAGAIGLDAAAGEQTPVGHAEVRGSDPEDLARVGGGNV